MLAGADREPRATPRQAAGGPEAAPSPARHVAPEPARPRPRRGERLRMRLAAALLRQPAKSPAIVTLQADD